MRDELTISAWDKEDAPESPILLFQSDRYYWCLLLSKNERSNEVMDELSFKNEDKEEAPESSIPQSKELKEQ